MKAPTASATHPVDSGCRLSLRPPTKLTPWQWSAENVRIQNSERATKFDPEQTPWWKAPLECAGDSDTREVVILAPTGSGKSTLAEALIPYVVSEDPGPMLYASQTDEDAKFWAESRLIPSLRSCSALSGLWPEDRHKSRKLEIIFPHMPLVLGGANLSNFQEKSMRWLYGDEVWTWNKGLVREFLARHHDRWNRKVFLVSQGGTTEGELHLEWLKTTQAEFSWRCQKCGHAQAYSFDSLRFDKLAHEDGTIDEQASADTARMECSACRHAYPDNVMTRRQLAGSNMHNGSLGYIPTKEGAIRGYEGFHVDSLAVWWVPWSAEVLGFLEAKRMLALGIVDKYRQWRQKRRALFWSDDCADAQTSLARSSDFTKADYEEGKPIEGEEKRFMTIDVGGNHFWVGICAWRGKGGGCRVLHEGFAPSEGGDETKLAALAKRYNVPDSHVFIDIGFEQDRIFDLCQIHGWTGIKGEGKKQSFRWAKDGKTVERLFSPRQRARAKRGGLVNFFFVATNPIKDILSRMLAGNGAPIELPADLSRAFEAHMRSERREMIRNAKTGEETAIWVTKNRNNHLWDVMVYQIGAALMFRLFDE
jgi:phage terminase large subunit GpA-like protein